MLKRLHILVLVIFGFIFQAKAQLTNQVAITPLINLTLLEGSDGASTNLFNSNEQILFAVTTANENGGGVFALLRPEQSFIFELHDAKGESVAKTHTGLEMSKSVDIKKGPRELEIRHQGVRGQLNYLFVPDNYFVITNKGIYKLDVQIRAWVQKTNKQYGVVVSPPLHVEVEKK